MYLPGTTAPPRRTTTPRPVPTATPTAPPLTLEWLVARDIDAYSARRRGRTAGRSGAAAASPGRVRPV
ncbi:hypothetical protein [Cellulosimicrobium marinum]|uniref:hypothetical protein n=1 Tax=Cellulosimicrobium marinum TaxID=1638992 RepID=UPI001E5A3AEC|nr:hypothetical protein [Cellulosimicrobium marinum]MCB7137657.1 hypothetical protein [Cellulosimicrobium marinum]